LLTPFSIFIISFCLLNFGFVCSFFPRNWGASLGYLFDIALFVNVGIHSYNLSSWHYLCCVPIILINYILFSFGSRKFYPPPLYFWWTTDHSSVYFSVSMFLKYSRWFFFLVISSNFQTTPLWSDKIQNIISFFLCLLRLALCLKIWSILEKITLTSEKNMYSTAVGWNILLTCCLFDQ
jgi:hypothetical protein